ncbi:MAG: class I SAM-dependent methyltransferase [Rubrobacteraceae bacterium]
MELRFGAGRGKTPEPLARTLTTVRRRAARQQQRIKGMSGRIGKLDERVAIRGRRISALQEEVVGLRRSASGVIEGLGEVPESSAEGMSGEGRPGLGLKPGDPHYRSWVGRPENYDLKAGMQVSLLLAAGLRETHRLVEVGCGSLRAGRMFIPYLLPGHYFGIEPNRWVLEEGIKHELGEDLLKIKRPSFRFVDDFSADGFGVEFDFALAQSIFSHTYPDMTLAGLEGISKALTPDGKLIANFVEREETTEDGTGWLYPGCTTHTWERMYEMMERCGLVARKIEWLPGMRWFVASRAQNEDEIDSLARRLRSPVTRSNVVLPSD